MTALLKVLQQLGHPAGDGRGAGLPGIIGDSHSSIVDAQSTMVLYKRIVKILALYDNEWGYYARLVDFAEFMGGKGLFTEKE